jgi:hypothetical protein
LGRGLGRCRPERITKHYFSFIGHFGLKNLGITINVLKEKEKKHTKKCLSGSKVTNQIGLQCNSCFNFRVSFHWSYTANYFVIKVLLCYNPINGISSPLEISLIM